MPADLAQRSLYGRLDGAGVIKRPYVGVADDNVGVLGMRCGSCAADVQATARFCASCGAVASGTVEASRARPVLVPEGDAGPPRGLRRWSRGESHSAGIIGISTALALGGATLGAVLLPGVSRRAVELLPGSAWVLSSSSKGEHAQHVDIASGAVDMDVQLPPGVRALRTLDDGTGVLVDDGSGTMHTLDATSENGILHDAPTRAGGNPGDVRMVSGKNAVWLVDVVRGRVQALTATSSPSPNLTDPPLRLAESDVEVAPLGQDPPAAVDDAGRLWVALRATGALTPVSVDAASPTPVPTRLAPAAISVAGQPLDVSVVDGRPFGVSGVGDRVHVQAVKPGGTAGPVIDLPAGSILDRRVSTTADPDGTRRLNVLAPAGQGHVLIRVDPTGDKPARRVPVDGLSATSRLAPVSSDSAVVIADSGTGRVSIVDKNDHVVVRQVGSPGQPLDSQLVDDSVLVNSASSEKALAVDTVGTARDVTKYDVSTGPVATPVPPPAKTAPPVAAPRPVVQPAAPNAPRAPQGSPSAAAGARTGAQSSRQSPGPTPPKTSGKVLPPVKPPAAPSAAAPAAPSAAAAVAGPPLPPAQLDATASKASATLTWTTAQAPAGLNGYDVGCVDPCPTPVTDQALPPDLTTLALPGLQNDGAPYTFRIRSKDVTGRTSEWVSFPPVAPSSQVPAAPTQVKADPDAAEQQLAVSWTPGAVNGASVTGFTVTATPSGRGTPITAPASGATATTATLLGLTNGADYSVTVAAKTDKPDVVGPASTTITARPYGAPGAPTSVVANRGDKTVQVQWAAPTDDGGRPVTGYVATLSPGGQSKNLPATTATSITTSFSGLTNGTTYKAVVTAKNARGMGTAASGVNARPAGTPTVTITAAEQPANRAVRVRYRVDWNGQDPGACSLSLAGVGGQGAPCPPAGGGDSYSDWGSLSYGKSYPATVTVTYSGGSASSATASAATNNPALSYSWGGSAQGQPLSSGSGNCNANCAWVVIHSRGWIGPLNGMQMLCSASDCGADNKHYRVVDLPGNGDFGDKAFYGFHGSDVWSDFDGVQGPHLGCGGSSGTPCS